MNSIMALVLLMAPPEQAAKDLPVVKKMHEVATAKRKAYGLEPQVLDEECCEIAQKWANHLAENNYFYHGGGEQIIAMGYDTSESVFGGWLASSGHRYWVLSGADKCGWGAAKSAGGTWFWVGVYRNNPKPVVETAPANYAPRRFRPLRRSRR